MFLPVPAAAASPRRKSALCLLEGEAARSCRELPAAACSAAGPAAPSSALDVDLPAFLMLADLKARLLENLKLCCFFFG